MATAAQLKRLRKKYGLGEYSKKRRKPKRARRNARSLNKSGKMRKRRKDAGRSKYFSGSRKKDAFLGGLDKAGIPGLGGGWNLPSPYRYRGE